MEKIVYNDLCESSYMHCIRKGGTAAGGIAYESQKVWHATDGYDGDALCHFAHYVVYTIGIFEYWSVGYLYDTRKLRIRDGRWICQPANFQE